MKLTIKVTAKIGEMTMIRVWVLAEEPSLIPDVGSEQEQPVKLHAHVSLLNRHMHAAWMVHMDCIRKVLHM